MLTHLEHDTQTMLVVWNSPGITLKRENGANALFFKKKNTSYFGRVSIRSTLRMTLNESGNDVSIFQTDTRTFMCRFKNAALKLRNKARSLSLSCFFFF
jgi:hypothetical protein